MKHFTIVFFCALVAMATAIGHRPRKCPLEQHEKPGCALIPPNPMPGQVNGIGAFLYNESSRNGPENWGNLDCINGPFAKFRSCSYCRNTCNGTLQSPVNIHTGYTFGYSKDLAPWINLHHHAQFEYEITPDNFELKCMNEGMCGTTTFRSRTFYLHNVHLHHFSEHHLDGKRFPMEMHFVHKAGDDLLVVAIFWTEGGFNRQLDKFIDISEKRCFGAINLSELAGSVTQPTNLLTYNGSTTTPPCSEGRTWAVSKIPLTATKRQIDRFNRLIANQVDSRPIQPLNGRTVVSYW